MSWSRNIARVGGGILLIWGCKAEVSGRSIAVEWRPDASGAGGAGDAQGGGGTGGATIRDAANSDVRPIPACQNDAGVGAATGRDAMPASDSGEPPTHCVAPCVWELMRQCAFQSPCTRQEYPGGHFGSNSVSCTPDASRWKIRTVAHVSHVDDYYRDDCHCYSHSTTLAGMTGDAAGTTNETWNDGAGRQVATGVVDTTTLAGRVCCTANFPPTADCYDVDPSQPDCARWMDPTCASGTCPAPPKVPVSPY